MRSSMQYPSHEYAISMREREAWPLVLPPYSPSRAGANPGNTGGPEDNLHPGDVGPPKKKSGSRTTHPKERKAGFIHIFLEAAFAKPLKKKFEMCTNARGS